MGKKILGRILGSPTPRKDRASDLDRAITAWRTSSEELPSISEFGRRRILNTVSNLRAQGRVPEASTPLFQPTRSLVLGTALPVVAMTVVLGLLLAQSGWIGTELPAQTTRIEALKQGGEVVFVITNGDQAHRISKSSRPDGNAEGEVFTAQGEFRDRLDAGADLVFYRID
jgi:hypothetical protein